MDQLEVIPKIESNFSQLKLEDITASFLSVFRHGKLQCCIERQYQQKRMLIAQLNNKGDIGLLILIQDTFQKFWIVIDKQVFEKNQLLKFVFQDPQELYNEIKKQSIKITANSVGELQLSDISIGKNKKKLKLQMNSLKMNVDQLSSHNQQLLKQIHLLNKQKEQNIVRQRLQRQKKSQELARNNTLWLLFPLSKPNIENQTFGQMNFQKGLIKITILLNETISFKTNFGKMYHHPLKVQTEVSSVEINHFVNRFFPSANSVITYSISCFEQNLVNNKYFIGFGTKLFCQSLKDQYKVESLLLDCKNGVLHEGNSLKQFKWTVDNNEIVKVTFDNVSKKVIWSKENVVIAMSLIDPKLKDKELYLVIRSKAKAQYKIALEEYMIY